MIHLKTIWLLTRCFLTVGNSYLRNRVCNSLFNGVALAWVIHISDTLCYASVSGADPRSNGKLSVIINIDIPWHPWLDDSITMSSAAGWLGCPASLGTLDQHLSIMIRNTWYASSRRLLCCDAPLHGVQLSTIFVLAIHGYIIPG